MAKQSATNPRFRCNGCKDYYSAPENKVHYKCAFHGYLCQKHIVKSGDKYNQDHYNGYKPEPFPEKYYGRCKLFTNPKSFKIYDWQKIEDEYCVKDPIKFNWHKDVGRWIEEGREEEEKAKAKPKTRSKTKPDYVKEIGVLLDLLEDGTLTQEVYIKKVREKLK